MTPSRSASSDRLAVTERARAGLQQLVAERGPLMLFQSGGCCDGSLPICLPAGALHIGLGDVLLGTIDGCPVYIGGEQDARWNHPRFLIDITDGAPEGFSLGGPDWHFVTRSP